MSKNFELLHHISNEKDLFQTLDGWEGIEEITNNAEPETELEERQRARTQQRSSLPDVFRTVDDTLGPLDLVPPELIREAAPAKDKIELKWEPKTLPTSPVPELQQVSNKTASSRDTKVQEPGPANEEKTHYEPPRAPVFRSIRVDDGKSMGDSRGRKIRARSAYKDPRREAIAHEEELKLVQRIFLADENSPQMALFSGFERDTSCASICIHAAEILAAQTEGSVCLVDMGFQAPSLHEYCGVQNERGLAEALAESIPIRDFAQQLSPANLWVLPAGHGAAQLNVAKVADRLRARTEELRKAFRYVIVHSGSLWLNADVMLISKWTDGVVLILEAHSTRRDTARRIKESLAAANARVLGVVLNNRTYPIPETLYSRL